MSSSAAKGKGKEKEEEMGDVMQAGGGVCFARYPGQEQVDLQVCMLSYLNANRMQTVDAPLGIVMLFLLAIYVMQCV